MKFCDKETCATINVEKDHILKPSYTENLVIC